ncbi:alpha-amylase [Maribacter sp. MJ134]|uniref:alpha-amylase family glycosyl hydrolase n=1 Tax=Maribacter sp. MJ134 TaxID=2496865 RepID=UPI000F82F273|nr:alpha-amylase family glycosyl hydrolase [Maribacter sp. MJ134]AZQ59224.1 alpha-amylase [Maribacter sp. MJ134]
MQNQIFYHIYPLGLVGTPKENDFLSAATNNLNSLVPWLEHLKALGCTALYLGPVFESTSHGYDTADYFQVDRRLGTKAQLQELVTKAHELGIKVILDAVFNHVGRNFWAFKDLRQKGERSQYRDWFANVDFSQAGEHGDGFTYDGWHGHYQLVALNLQHPEVRAHLFSAVSEWMDRYGLDGLRLDAADVIDLDFLEALRTFCTNKKQDFWLLGEVVFGDYREWANANRLHSVTNYEYHTPLSESFNRENFEHIASILRRQFGPAGTYKDLTLYSFVDNHDVDRAASALAEPAHLFPLYLLLFTLPGIPAIYYGSEWGFEGRIKDGTHDALRPKAVLGAIEKQAKHPLLLDSIKRFTALRKTNKCLRQGDYKELLVQKEQLVFARALDSDVVICIINASRHVVNLEIPLGPYTSTGYKDLLNPEYSGKVRDGMLRVEIPSCWGRVLAPLD